jgi:hypothetical protein
VIHHSCNQLGRYLTPFPLLPALHMASANGYLVVVEYLIRNGAVRKLLVLRGFYCTVLPDKLYYCFSFLFKLCFSGHLKLSYISSEIRVMVIIVLYGCKIKYTILILQTWKKHTSPLGMPQWT